MGHNKDFKQMRGLLFCKFPPTVTTNNCHRYKTRSLTIRPEWVGRSWNRDQRSYIRVIDGLGFKLKEIKIFVSLIIPRNKFGQYGRSFAFHYVTCSAWRHILYTQTTSDFTNCDKTQDFSIRENPVSSGTVTICFCKLVMQKIAVLYCIWNTPLHNNTTRFIWTVKLN